MTRITENSNEDAVSHGRINRFSRQGTIDSAVTTKKKPELKFSLVSSDVDSTIIQKRTFAL